MTAFGFALFVIGVLIAMAFHDHYSEWKIMDTVAAILLSVGIISMVAGITIWLYRVMP